MAKPQGHFPVASVPSDGLSDLEVKPSKRLRDFLMGHGIFVGFFGSAGWSALTRPEDATRARDLIAEAINRGELPKTTVCYPPEQD